MSMAQVEKSHAKSLLTRVSRGEILMVEPIAAEPPLPLWLCEVCDGDSTDAADVAAKLTVDVCLPFGAIQKPAYERPFKLACICSEGSTYHELSARSCWTAAADGKLVYHEGHGRWTATIDRSQIVVRNVRLNVKSGTISATGEASSSRDVFKALDDRGKASAALVPAKWATTFTARRATGKGARPRNP